jgi:hypothetical protein
MTEVFSASPAEMGNDAEQLLQPIADTALSISTKTRDALVGLGSFYGTDDEVAQAFAEKWGPAVSGVLQLLTSFGTGMGLTASNYVASAVQYQKADEANTEAADRLGLA